MEGCCCTNCPHYHEPNPPGAWTVPIQLGRLLLTPPGRIEPADLWLTPTERRLLVTLAGYHPRTMPEEAAAPVGVDAATWVASGSLRTHVCRMRRKLSRYGADVVTVRGVGYRLMEG